MSNFASSKEIILPGLRAQWLDVFQPSSGEINGKPTEPKYKFVGLMTPDSPAATAAKAGLLEAARALWGDNAINVVQNISGKLCFFPNRNHGNVLYKNNSHNNNR